MIYIWTDSPCSVIDNPEYDGKITKYDVLSLLLDGIFKLRTKTILAITAKLPMEPIIPWSNPNSL